MSLKVVLALVLLLMTSCSKLPSSRPSDFTFILSYGPTLGNTINTLNRTLTKEISLDKDTTINFVFNDSQLDSIYSNFLLVDLFEYPNDFVPADWETSGNRYPSSVYKIKVKISGKEKEVFWGKAMQSKNIKAVQLDKLFSLIIGMVLRSPEYQSLPESTVSYM